MLKDKLLCLDDRLKPILDEELKEAVLSWQHWLAYESQVSENTLSSYKCDMFYFLEFMNIHEGEVLTIEILKNLKITDFRSYLASETRKGHSSASLARAMSTTRSFFRWLDKNKQVHNPNISIVKSPKHLRNIPRSLDEKDIEDVIEVIEKLHKKEWLNKRDKAVFYVLYGCGLRIGEAMALNYGVVPDNGGTMVITGKGNKQRIVPILPIVAKAIKDYISKCPHKFKKGKALFLGTQGKRLDAGVLQRNMRKIRRKLSLSETITPHSLRHSFATHILNSGGDLRSIQELLGHSSLSSTQIYTDIDIKKIATIYDDTDSSKTKKSSF